jgi:hypothetical protein
MFLKKTTKNFFFIKKTMLNNEIRKENKPKRECRPTFKHVTQIIIHENTLKIKLKKKIITQKYLR